LSSFAAVRGRAIQITAAQETLFRNSVGAGLQDGHRLKSTTVATSTFPERQGADKAPAEQELFRILDAMMRTNARGGALFWNKPINTVSFNQTQPDSLATAFSNRGELWLGQEVSNALNDVAAGHVLVRAGKTLSAEEQVLVDKKSAMVSMVLRHERMHFQARPTHDADLDEGVTELLAMDPLITRRFARLSGLKHHPQLEQQWRSNEYKKHEAAASARYLDGRAHPQVLLDAARLRNRTGV
jgi:hypothetical protein